MVKLLKLIGFISIMALSGCDGPSSGATDSTGGSSSGTGVELVPGVNLTMSISSTGVVANAIPVNDEAKVEIVYLDALGEPLANELINLSATSGSLTQPTVLTKNDGTAVVSITPPNITTGTAPGRFAATPESSGEATSFNYEFVATTLAETPEEAAAFASSIQFLSASTDFLSLKGTGGVGYGESSNLVFKVVDNENNPIAGVQVNFTLTTTVGGLALSAVSSTSNGQGEAFVNVLAGTISTPVRVTASITTINGRLRSAQSDLLTVTTGIPDQNSFSLSVDNFAPEGLDTDGETVAVTARLADRFNNPVPDGTVVNFTAEGGSIGSSCQTSNGVCSVTWTSQNPRPLDHRVTILAYAIGHETFYDFDGSGIFDDGDSFDDLGEIFRDDDENGTYNPTFSSFSRDEKLIDYDESGDYTLPDGDYNGVPCEHSTDCPTDANNIAGRSNLLVNVGLNTDIIMAADFPNVHLYELLNGNSTCLNAIGKLVIDGVQCQAVSSTFAVGGGSKNLWVLIEDTAALCKTSEGGDRIEGVYEPDDPACLFARRQAGPSDSSIAVTSKVGTVKGTVPSSNLVNGSLLPTEFNFLLESSDSNAESITDVLEVVVTTPNGNETTRFVWLTDPAN